jgi:hypothetical protein
MPRSMKPIVTSGALLVGIAVAACTQVPGTAQIAAVPASDAMSADRALTLPAVTVVAPQPYASGNGPRASSGNRIPQSHFQPWPGYYSDVSMHPYTSGVGPRTSSGNRIPMSHFRVWPGYDSDASRWKSGRGARTAIVSRRESQAAIRRNKSVTSRRSTRSAASRA